jgi:hypothetical protein
VKTEDAAVCTEGKPIEAIIIRIKDTEVINIPRPILPGELGSFDLLFNHAKAATNIGVKNRMNNGLNDWKLSGDIELESGK